MTKQPETRSDPVLITLAHHKLEEVPCHLEPATRTIVRTGVAILMIAIPVVVMVWPILYPAGATSEVGQVHPSTSPGNDPRTTQSLTGECTMYEMMTEFSDSLDYCQSRNSRLLNEQDTKTASCDIRRGEDFWAVPEKRNASDCFIYNTKNGFMQMHCSTRRWFICVKT